MQLNREIIEKIQEYVKDKPINKIWLFGSYSREEADTESDIDLLVDVDFSQKIGWNYFGWWTDLEAITGKEIDFVVESALSQYVFKNVEKDKILIYEKR